MFKQGTENFGKNGNSIGKVHFSLSVLFPVEAELNYGINFPNTLTDYLG